MVIVDLALAGVGVGALAALAGLGLLVTYRVTGVFNLAFGAIAVLAAYLLWQAVRVWHWPLAPAAALDLLVICPAIGLLLDRAVFRPLQRRGASPAESLVATLGVFVLIVGAVTFIWGSQARPDAPALLSARIVTLPGGASVRRDTLLDLGTVLVVGLGLAVVMRTRLGLLARAVVEQRDLAELTAIDADEVSAIAWAVGAFLAGLAGILLAPRFRLDPFGLTLVVLGTMAVVVVARLVSPLAVILTGLAIGIAQSELTRYHLSGSPRVLLEALSSNLFVVVLLVALIALRRLDDGSHGAGATGGLTSHLASRRELPPPRGWWLPALFLLTIPLLLSGPNLQSAQQVPALAVIFVSIVVVTGYTGQISLGQAGLAGLGALFAAKLAHGQVPGIPSMPGIVALPVAVVLVGLFGLLVAWPAIRRRGLFLALTTFAIAVVVSRFVFDQPRFVSDVVIGPPRPFTGDRSYYLFELACLGAALIVVRNHHRGRLGRALLAVRDDEPGADACGVDAHRLRIWAFAVSSGLAALGGALLAASFRSFDASTFDPIEGLIWFAAVVVFGVDSAAGAVLGAALIVGVDATARLGVSTIVIGIGAVLLGRLPGGVLYSLRRLEVEVRSGRELVRPTTTRLSPAGEVLRARLRTRSGAVARSTAAGLGSALGSGSGSAGVHTDPRGEPSGHSLAPGQLGPAGADP
ncbi:MAG: ABC transporter permease [Acidimicrobiales bacterium]